MTLDELDELIVAALRQEHGRWPGAAGLEALEQILDVIADHGVTALLASAPALESWPDGIRSAIRDATRFEIAVEAIRRQELTRLLADFASDGVRGLLLKGAHLAYSHYPQPWMRPRLDTDLLVAPGDRDRAIGCCERWDTSREPSSAVSCVTPSSSTGGRIGMASPTSSTCTGRSRTRTPLPMRSASTSLDAESIAIDALGPGARGASPAHALLIACVHRAAHHDNSDCLIWLYDIHLLARAMTAQHRASVANLAERKGLRSICIRGIADANARFVRKPPRTGSS